MTKRQFLKRCKVAWNAGLINPEIFQRLEEWISSITQLKENRIRILTRDTIGYKTIQLAALLNHKCQECAENPQAHWTRPGPCPHKESKKGKDNSLF